MGHTCLRKVVGLIMLVFYIVFFFFFFWTATKNPYLTFSSKSPKKIARLIKD